MQGHVMYWRLVGSGFVCFTLVLCVAASLADEVPTDDASNAKSPLNEPGDPSVVSSIDRMKHRLAEGMFTDRILLSLKIIEVEPEQLIDFIVPLCELYQLRWGTWLDEPRKVTNRLTWFGLWDADELQQLTNRPETPSWSSPPITLVSGREARYKLGGSIPVPRLTDDGVSHLLNETYGRSIVATATISNLTRIHLVVASEVNDQTTSNGFASTGNNRRIDAAFELHHGETRVFGRKVVSTSGRETYQLIQATAWLKPFEVPLAPETIPVSAVEELSTPEKDVAEFNATHASQSGIAVSGVTMRVPVAPSQLVNRTADDSVFARQTRRINSPNFADEVRMSVVVTEVTREDFEREHPHYGERFSFRYIPCFWASFATTDVVGVETIGEPFASRSQSTEFDCSDWSGRICRPNRLGASRSGKKWTMATTRAQSGSKFLWRSGGEVPVFKLDQYGGELVTNEQFGVTVTATPTISDLDEIQVHLDIALKDLTQSGKSLRVESARRMQTTVRVRNGEIVSYGQPTVSDTGMESFLTVSMTASTVAPNHERDFETVSALFPENSDVIDKITPVNATFATLFGVGKHHGCWADSIPLQFRKINQIMEAFECRRLLQPDAEVSQLSYRLSHPFDESSQLFADP
jgi:hypothetical protein